MDLNDMTPAGGGALRGGPAKPARQTVGTLRLHASSTQTRSGHRAAAGWPRQTGLSAPRRTPTRVLSLSVPCLRPTWRPPTCTP